MIILTSYCLIKHVFAHSVSSWSYLRLVLAFLAIQQKSFGIERAHCIFTGANFLVCRLLQFSLVVLGGVLV